MHLVSIPFLKPQNKKGDVTMTTYESDLKLTKALLLMGGIVSLVFGLLLLTRTQRTFEVIMLLVGLWWLIEGLFDLLVIFIVKSQWGWNLFGGIFGILAGLLVLNFPVAGGAVAASILVIIIGVFGLIFGIAAIIAAFQGGGWGAGLFGVVSAIIGLLFIFNSLASAQILLWIFAILMIVQGAAALYLGFAYKE
jgi:uncharacterized membrane protein HdeD (DUF308 family)